jgi:hypothetical protein
MKEEAHALFMPVAVQMVYAVCVEQAGAAFDAVDDVTFIKQELSEVRAVLASDTGDECYFGLCRH